MTAPADAIATRRRLSNKFIAAKQAERLRPFFAPHATVIVGGGGVLSGAGEIVAAFADQMSDRTFISYERTPEVVEIDTAGETAAERGRWIGRWTGGEMSGTYLATWKKQVGQWVIESELYVTLTSA